MPSGLEYLDIATLAGSVLACAYILLVSLLIRRTLAVRPYRRQALGIGLVAAFFALNGVGEHLPADGPIGLVQLFAFYALALGLLYWVDASVLAARRLDPLYRDTLGWSRLRPWAWGVSLGLLFFMVTTFVLVPPPPANAPPPPIYVSLFFPIAFLIPIYIAAISGVVFIPVAARRCKDPVFRKNLEWFFAFITIQLALAGVVSQIFQNSDGTSVVSFIFDSVALIIGFYPLYRAVKSLVPLYKFGEGESAGPWTTPAGAESHVRTSESEEVAL